ncbi:MAG: PorV/PorQ family protein [Bacteroidia bacterium]|nr:PorV/PorQ family protein [Bacteroidia bacterium]
MKKGITYLLLLGLAFVSARAQLIPRLGGQRAGISALTFLKIDVSPRSSALSSANICLDGDAYSTYTNPASMAQVENLSFAAANTFWVAGINHAFLSSVIPTKNGNFGVSLTSLTTGKMERRTEFQPDGTGEYFYASNTAVGLSYAKQLTDMFSYGVTLKYVNESLAEFQANTAVVDLGFLYRTDFKDLKFAVVLQSFGLNSKLKGTYQQDDISIVNKPVTLESYPAPTLFQLGVSMVPFRNEQMSLTTALQLNHPNDNAENIRLGAEFEYRQLFFFRAGYKINVKDQVFPTFGAGLQMRVGGNPLKFDYGVDPTRYLGWVHRVGLSVYFSGKREKGGQDAQE